MLPAGTSYWRAVYVGGGGLDVEKMSSAAFGSSSFGARLRALLSVSMFTSISGFIPLFVFRVIFGKQMTFTVSEDSRRCRVHVGGLFGGSRWYRRLWRNPPPPEMDETTFIDFELPLPVAPHPRVFWASDYFRTRWSEYDYSTLHITTINYTVPRTTPDKEQH